MRKISKPKEIPYHIFWASKGEYGKERLRRFKERLDERMFRKSHVCPKCRNSHKATSPTYCPYD